MGMMRRRQVFQAVGAAVAASALGGGVLGQTRRLERVGLQLYTLREEMAEDFGGTLAKVAELGYREMEFAGYFGHGAGEVRRLLEDNGLSSPATHIPLDAVRNNLAAEIEFAAALGQRFVVVPFVAANERALDDYRRLAETLNRAGEECRAAGMRMGYHNHDFEFQLVEGRVPYDVLLEETEPWLVDMELDLFWTVHAGVDPAALFATHPGRFSMLHVKDRTADGAMVDVGTGTIDFAGIFAQGDNAGFQHFFVEHDNPGDGFASVTNSIRHLRALVY